MSTRLEGYHWINTFVGILNQAYHLSDTEQVHSVDIISRLLTSLNIPDRADPSVIPAPLAHEMTTHAYAEELASPRETGFSFPPRAAVAQDIIVSIEAWCEALVGMLVTAYPDLSPTERLVCAKVFSDLLDAIGVPDRAATFFPDDVVRAAREIDAIA